MGTKRSGKKNSIMDNYSLFAGVLMQFPGALKEHHIAIHESYKTAHPDECPDENYVNENGRLLKTSYSDKAVESFMASMESENQDDVRFSDFCNLVHDAQTLNPVRLPEDVMLGLENNNASLGGSVKKSGYKDAVFLLQPRMCEMLNSFWQCGDDVRFSKHVPSDIVFDGNIHYKSMLTIIRDNNGSLIDISGVFTYEDYETRIEDAADDECVQIGEVMLVFSATYSLDILVLLVPFGVIKGCDFLLVSQNVKVASVVSSKGTKADDNDLTLNLLLERATIALRTWYSIEFMKCCHPVGCVLPDVLSKQSFSNLKCWDIRRSDAAKLMKSELLTQFKDNAYSHGHWFYNKHGLLNYTSGHWPFEYNFDILGPELARVWFKK